MNHSAKQSRPEWIGVKAFGVAIVTGAILLCLPVSSAEGRWTSPLVSLFTATSATCVTGLTIVDTGSYFSRFGQIVILCLIQAGGLGIMTLSTVLLVAVGRRLSLHEEIALGGSLGRQSGNGLRRLLFGAMFLTVFAETAGGMVLYWRLITQHNMPQNDAAYSAAFHSISAFCNAGFSLYPDSLCRFRSDSVFLLVMAVMIVLGGLGFIVLDNLVSLSPWSRNRIRRGRISLHSRIVLAASALLICAGAVFFLVMEWHGVLSDMSIGEKTSVSLFQAVTPRTAGFNVVETGDLCPSTFFFTLTLMFIGGAPGSTAGGIKVTTVVIMVLTMATMASGRRQTVLYGRAVSEHVTREAISIFVLALACVAACFQLLLLTEHGDFVSGGAINSDELLFETVSAFGTVGLSTGITSALSAPGKLVLIFCRFVGRLGPMTIALLIGRKGVAGVATYPEEAVIVG
jgi:trk system potassium uptake protein TrkH